jgi:hypothetical protein
MPCDAWALFIARSDAFRGNRQAVANGINRGVDDAPSPDHRRRAFAEHRDALAGAGYRMRDK